MISSYQAALAGVGEGRGGNSSSESLKIMSSIADRAVRHAASAALGHE
jgi:hypothetical protein